MNKGDYERCAVASVAGGTKDAGDVYPFPSTRGLDWRGWILGRYESTDVSKFTVQNDIMPSLDLCRVTSLRKMPGCTQPWQEPAGSRGVEIGWDEVLLR